MHNNKIANNFPFFKFINIYKDKKKYYIIVQYFLLKNMSDICPECGKSYKKKDMYKRDDGENICRYCIEEIETFYGKAGE